MKTKPAASFGLMAAAFLPLLSAAWVLELERRLGLDRRPMGRSPLARGGLVRRLLGQARARLYLDRWPLALTQPGPGKGRQKRGRRLSRARWKKVKL